MWALEVKIDASHGGNVNGLYDEMSDERYICR